jgi:hypothetical protein
MRDARPRRTTRPQINRPKEMLPCPRLCRCRAMGSGWAVSIASAPAGSWLRLLARRWSVPLDAAYVDDGIDGAGRLPRGGETSAPNKPYKTTFRRFGSGCGRWRLRAHNPWHIRHDPFSSLLNNWLSLHILRPSTNERIISPGLEFSFHDSYPVTRLRCSRARPSVPTTRSSP